MVYLTFDDGPDVYGGTGDVAAELKKLKVPATFFVLGTLAQSPEGQTQLAALRQEGFNIGVHGWTHSDVRRWSGVEVSDMLTQTAQNITSATYASPTCFRPPYGS